MHGSMTLGKELLDLQRPVLLVEDVENKLRRACKTLRAVPDPDRRFQWIGCAWPETVRSKEDAYGYTEASMPRFRPKPSDVSEYLDVLGWCRGMDWKDFRLIWWRSFDVSFRQIGLRIFKSDETARRWYRDVILKAWHRANIEFQQVS